MRKDEKKNFFSKQTNKITKISKKNEREEKKSKSKQNKSYLLNINITLFLNID